MPTISSSTGNRSKREKQRLAGRSPKVTQPGFGTGKGVQKLASTQPKAAGRALNSSPGVYKKSSNLRSGLGRRKS